MKIIIALILSLVSMTSSAALYICESPREVKVITTSVGFNLDGQRSPILKSGTTTINGKVYPSMHKKKDGIMYATWTINGNKEFHVAGTRYYNCTKEVD